MSKWNPSFCDVFTAETKKPRKFSLRIVETNKQLTYNQEFRRQCHASPRIQPRGRRSTQSKIQFAATENANDLNTDSIVPTVRAVPVWHNIHDIFQIVHAPFDNQPTLKTNIKIKIDVNSQSIETVAECDSSTYHR